MTHLENHDAKNDRQGDDLFSLREGSDHGEDSINLTGGHAGQTSGGTPAAAEFGRALQAAREQSGLALETCGQALHLPVRLLRKLERGDYDGIDYQVYLSGYLCKYGRHVGVDQALIDAEIERVRPREPALVSAGTSSRSRYLLQRYLTAGKYVAFTALIASLVWLGVRGGLGRNMARLAPLDSAPVTAHGAPAQAAANSSRDHAEQPLQASMAPFPALEGSARDRRPAGTPAAARPVAPATGPAQTATMPTSHPQASTPAAAPTPVPATAPTRATAAAGTHSHTLELQLSHDSWVEISTRAGKRLAYGLLPAGTRRTLHMSQPLDVLIGDADGARLSLDGKPLPLAGYRHDKVARLHIALEQGRAVPSQR